VESNNRHFKYFNSETRGYNIMEVTPDKLTCTMKAVSTIKQPEATLSTLKVFEVPDGVVRIDDVTPAP
jgi:alkaline phosphatase D